MNRVFFRGMIAMVSIVVCGLSCRSGAQTNPLPSAKKWPAITSHQRNFIVVDMPRRDALEIAVWAESVRERLSNWIQAPIPGERSYPIVIGAILRPDEPIGRVLKAQDFTEDRFLRQELTMINPASMDQEDVLEALCWLLLNRWIHVRQPIAERMRKPGAFPDWFAVGIAQNLYPELRARNVRDVLALERSGEYVSAVTVFDQMYLAPGRWPEKARAGLVVAWLADTMSAAKLVTSSADVIADGDKLDINAMTALLQIPGPSEVNKLWDLWMARQDRILIPGMVSSDHTNLARVLELHADDFGLILREPLPGDRLTAEMLIDHREEEWVHRCCRAVSLRLRQEAVAKTPELVARINDFIVFFDALAYPVEQKDTKKKDKKKKTKKKSDRWLRSAWNDADSSWRDYVTKQQQQRELLDRIANPAPLGGEPDALRSMLNRWEPAE